MPTPFHPFGPDHWIILISVFVTALGMVLGGGPIRKFREDRPLRYSLAFILLAVEVTTWFFYRARGLMVLPFHLCDWALFLMTAALLTKNSLVTELAFFWGLTGSLQALLTPDLREGFPGYPWISFFLSHSGVVLGAVYLSVKGEVRVSLAAVGRVWLWTNFYAAVAGLINWRLGTNFGYLAGKPERPSLLDYLGPWPYYILWSELIALLFFFLCYGFNRLTDKLASRHSEADPARGLLR